MTKHTQNLSKMENQIELIEKFNNTFKVGSKVNVKQDDGSIKEWTVGNEATLMGGHIAVGWFKEHRGAYMLSRVV